MITSVTFYRRLSLWTVSCWALAGFALALAQGEPDSRGPANQAEMRLRKSVVSREFQGRRFAGEERRIGPGDSLWRILVKEKGLPERRFHSYLVVIRGLNPQIDSLDVLRIGDQIFIPLRVGDGEQSRSIAVTGRDQERTVPTVNYRIKAGDHVYRILREQLKLSDERELAQHYALLKDLNPERKNWDNLFQGEVIRLPRVEVDLAIKKSETPEANATKEASDTVRLQTTAPKPSRAARAEVAIVPAESVARPPIVSARPTADQVIRSPARNNMGLFVKVAQALGNEVQQRGEEVVTLPDGAVRFDKSAYPVVYNAMLRQRVVIDPDGNIPSSLKAKLGDPSIGTPVLAMADGLSVYQAVRELLVGLGYQLLPTEKPIVVHEGGVAFEAKGDWMALAPEVSNRAQEILIITLADSAALIPDYLRTPLAKQGLSFRQVVLTDAGAEAGKMKVSKVLESQPTPPRMLAGDKREIVDALLLSFGVAFGVAENISVELHEGLRVDQRADRLFEWSGSRTGLFFRPLDPAITQALRDKHGIRTVELDIDALSSRQVIGRVLNLLGDQAAYREHRFPAGGSAPDRLTVKAWGFHIPRKGMFVTDRQIPPALHPFFFEKGLEIVYFR